MDPTLPVFDVRTLEDALAESITPRRFNVLLLTVFAGVALLLAVTGVYAVVAHSVGQRTHEIGIRMAVGANRRHVVVVRESIGTALAGIAIGVAAALYLTRLMESLLFDVSPTDPQTFTTVVAGLIVTALSATLVPAVSAARVEPAEMLR